MLDPTSLYLSNPALLEDARVRGLPLIVALSGYAEAGHVAVQIEHAITDALPHEVVARFDLDQLYDYRARRPHVRFAEDHFEDFQDPELSLRLVTDGLGRSFALLTGPEPDLQWNRFTEAVVGLARRMDVSLVAIVSGIPMPVPHTRPFIVSVHGNRADLLPAEHAWKPVVEMSSSAAQLLEIRLGEAGIDNIGFTVHVPQYLAEAHLPHAAVAALEHISAVTSLTLPSDELREAAREIERQIDQQVGASPEVQAVVAGLEQRYDDVVDASAPRSLLVGDESELPDADEIGAAAEAFLAAREDEQD